MIRDSFYRHIAKILKFPTFLSELFKSYRSISQDEEKGASCTGEKQTTFTMILLKQQQPVFDLGAENLNSKQRTSCLHSSVYCLWQFTEKPVQRKFQPYYTNILTNCSTALQSELQLIEILIKFRISPTGTLQPTGLKK